MKTTTVILILVLALVGGPPRAGQESGTALREQKTRAPLQPVPQDWPEQWCGRKLHRNEHAFIYAQKKAAAAEVAEMLQAVVEDLGQEGPMEPARGLIVVIDAQERFPLEIAKLAEILNDPNGPMKGEGAKEVLKSIREGRKISDQAGADMNSLVAVTPIPIRPATLAKITPEFPEGADREIAWCLIVPTDRYVRTAMKAVIDAMVKIDKMNWKERLLVGVFTPLAQHEAGKRIKRTQQADLYQLWVEGQQNLSQELKAEKIKAYRQRLGLEDGPAGDEGNEKAEKEQVRNS